MDKELANLRLGQKLAIRASFLGLGLMAACSGKDNSNSGIDLPNASNVNLPDTPVQAAAFEAFPTAGRLEASTARPGERPPDFEAKTIKGETFRLSDWLGKTPMVLIFSSGSTNPQQDFRRDIQLQRKFGDGLKVIVMPILGEVSGDFNEVTVLKVAFNEEIMDKYTPIARSYLLIDGSGRQFGPMRGPFYTSEENGGNSAIVKDMLEADLPYDSARAPHFLPFEPDKSFAGPAALDNYKQRYAGLHIISSQVDSVEIQYRVFDADYYAVEGKKEQVSAENYLREGNRAGATAMAESSLRVLLEAGRGYLEVYCQTGDERFKSMVEAVGSLTYFAYEDFSGRGLIESSRWQDEQMFRSFDTSCQSPFLGL